MSETNESKNDSESDDTHSSRSQNRKRGGKSSKQQSRKRRKHNDEFRAYEKYARWQAQTLSPFIDYFALLDIGIPRWEKSSFGKLSEDEFYEVHKDTINRYIDLQDCVPDFHNNFLKLMQSSRQTNKLAKAMHDLPCFRHLNPNGCHHRHFPSGNHLATLGCQVVKTLKI